MTREGKDWGKDWGQRLGPHQAISTKRFPFLNAALFAQTSHFMFMRHASRNLTNACISVQRFANLNRRFKMLMADRVCCDIGSQRLRQCRSC